MTKPEINLINTTDINMDDLTPAMKHFLEVKREHPECLTILLPPVNAQVQSLYY